MDIPLPLTKLAMHMVNPDDKDKKYAVLVATGSFNPPTDMHLRMISMELTRDALNSEGFCVIGGYISPVNDAYNKRSQAFQPVQTSIADGNIFLSSTARSSTGSCAVEPVPATNPSPILPARPQAFVSSGGTVTITVNVIEKPYNDHLPMLEASRLIEM